MNTPTVAIVGLGQIGGSFAAALTRRRLARVVGVTRRPATARRAKRMGLLAEAGTDLRAASRADVVVLATPVRTLLRQIPEVAALARPGALLTDVGSTKGEIVRAFRRARPRGPVLGGHPMAGNERAGLDGVDADLFVDRPWILIGRKGEAEGFVRLVRGVGARPVWMRSAAEHDRAVAAVSHVPYLLAYALARQPEKILRVAGNSFRDATRVALSDPDMVLDFLLTNPAAIRRAAREFTANLEELLRRLARGDAAGLRTLLQRARSARSTL